MPLKVYITIDTEEDQWGDFDAKRASVDNVAMIPSLQKVFDRYGAIPTYLVNYPVVTNKTSRSIIKEIFESGRCGIGTHCHPWNTPPLKERLSIHNSMLCNLPYDLILEKIKVLHQAITDTWGITPICFRAGRWSFGETVARCIHELGYKIDTSITPFNDWSAYGGPDFSQASADEYFFKPDNIFTKDPRGSLLEVPPTIGFTQSNFKGCSTIRKWIASSTLFNHNVLGLLDAFKLLNFRWLSPELSSGEDMVSLARTFIRKGCKFLNVSFHSTSIVPGLGPFVRSKADLERFMRNNEIFLEFACKNGFKFAPLDEAIRSDGGNQGYTGIAL